MLYKGFTAFFPLISTVYISRILLPTGVGMVAYANTIVTYFTVIASLGIPNYGVRAIAGSEGTEEKSRSFIELFIINLISTLACIFVYYTIINHVAYFADLRPLFNVTGILLVLNIFNIDWFYQGCEEYDYIAIRGVMVKLCSFGLMLLLVREQQDYIIYALILCLAAAGNNLLNLFHLRRYIKFRKYRLTLKKHLKPILILLASSLAMEIYTMLDTVMLEHFHGSAYVAYYSNSAKIVRMIYTLSVALVAAFYPRISYLISVKDYAQSNALLSKGLKIVLCIAVPCTAGLFLLSDEAVGILYGSEFMPAAGTVRILSVLITVFTIAYYLGQMVLMASSNEKYILISTIAGACVNLAANLFLIPKYYHYGAAAASILAELMVTLIQVYFAHYYFRLDLSARYLGSLGIALILMSGTVFILHRILTGGISSLIITVVLGAALYFAALFATKNEVMTDLSALLKRLIR